MQKAVWFLFLAWSTVASAQTRPALPPAEKTSPSYASEAGEIELSSPHEEPVKVRYQYGPIPEIRHGTHLELLQAAETIATLQETTDPDGSVIVIEAEGSPATLPAEITDRVSVEHIVLPKTIVERFKNLGRHVYVKPRPAEWVLGGVFFSLRVVTTGPVFLAAPDLPWELGVLTTLGVASLSAVSTIYKRSFRRLYEYQSERIKIEKTSSQKSFRTFSRRMLYNTATTHLINLLSGWRNTEGHLIANILSGAVVSNLFDTQVERVYEKTPNAGLSYALLLSPLTYAIQAMDGTGHSAALFHISQFAVTAPILETFAVYAAAISLNAIASKPMARLLQKIDQVFLGFIDRTLIKIKGFSKGFCRNAMDSEDALPGAL